MSIENNNIPDNPQIEVLKPKCSGIFTNYIYKAIPLAFDESMSYYETLLGLLHYLKFTILPTLNNNADATIELQNLYIELKNYVENYFNNLDVQEEINNKLDAMVEDGTLDQIIEQYLNSSALWCFDNVESMKSATNLINGSYAKTLGYYSKNDGGESIYKIRTKEIGDITNEMDLINISDTLLAELIISNQTINIKQFGAKGNGTDNDTSILNYAFGLPSSKVKKIYLNEKYLINSTLNIANNKDIIGIKNNLQYNEDYNALILTESDIKMIDIDSKTNITLKNISLKHPVTNTSTVVDFSKSRYIKLENIQCYHDTTTKASCIAFDDTINQSTSGFSGYIEFKNVRASYYDISLKSKATLIDLKNCVFNNANTYNIYFLGEVLGIENCDISYSTSGKAIRTDSVYNLNIINSYFEGFYQDRCFEKTNNININLKGSKFYIATGLSASEGRKFEITDKYPQPLRNVLNNLQDGHSSFVNLLPNGKFDKGTFGWNINAIGEITIQDKTEMGSIGLPQYMNHALKVNNGNLNHDFSLETFNENDYITIGYWIYVPSASDNKPYITVSDTSNANGIISDRPSQKDKWIYHTTYAKVTSGLAGSTVRLRIAFGQLLYITGISLMRGIVTDLNAELTPNSNNIMTDNLVIKGTDNKYYKITTDGTDLILTEVTTI